jgi:hypothetical protein
VDVIHTITQTPEAKPQVAKHILVIKVALVLIAIMCFMLVSAVVITAICSLFGKVPTWPAALDNVIIVMFCGLLFAALTIIGSYSFSVQWDTNNYRDFLVAAFNAIK